MSGEDPDYRTDTRQADAERDIRDLVAELTSQMNDPDPGIMFEAVDIVVERFHPKRVIIHGPTAKGFVRGRKVRMVVIVESGDTGSLWGDIVWDLAMEGIDGDVAVYTEDVFEESRHDSSTVAYEASRTGFVAYPPGGVV